MLESKLVRKYAWGTKSKCMLSLLLSLYLEYPPIEFRDIDSISAGPQSGLSTSCLPRSILASFTNKAIEKLSFLITIDGLQIGGGVHRTE